MTDLQLYGYSYLDFKSADTNKKYTNNNDSGSYYFNPRMVKINNEFIFCVRKITSGKNIPYDKIIPGNRS